MARKRKVEPQDQDDGHVRDKPEDANHSVLGGMRGGYRTDGEDAEEPGVGQYKVPYNDKAIICEQRGGTAQLSLIFTHGAGGGIANPATKEFANGFADVSTIVCFQGTMNLQNRVKTFHAVMEHEQFNFALGGRSMGARAAAIAATQKEGKVKALVLVSFPLVGGKKGESREQVLLDLLEDVEVLFVNGGDDAQCDLPHLRKVMARMSARSWLCEVKGADHGMCWKPKGSVAAMRRKTGEIAAEWLRQRDQDRRYCCVESDDEVADVRVAGWKKDDQIGGNDQQQEPKTKKRKKG